MQVSLHGPAVHPGVFAVRYGLSPDATKSTGGLCAWGLRELFVSGPRSGNAGNPPSRGRTIPLR